LAHLAWITVLTDFSVFLKLSLQKAIKVKNAKKIRQLKIDKLLIFQQKGWTPKKREAQENQRVNVSSGGGPEWGHFGLFIGH
jgi:hypothetical protein